MTKSEYKRRFVVYLIGLYIMALGMSMLIASGLGTSPVSTWTYVMSLNTSLSVGTWTFILSIILIIGQCFLLRKDGLLREWYNIALQLPFALLFGAFIDFNLAIVSYIPLPYYWTKLILLILGVVVQSYGIMLEVKSNVTMTSAEAFVNYASYRFNCQFGKLKVWFDISLVMLAIMFSIFFSIIYDSPVISQLLEVVREGTLIAALSTGLCVAYYSRENYLEVYFVTGQWKK